MNNKVIFTTTDFAQKQFTTGWSYLTDNTGQPCRGQITLSDNQVVCESKESAFALNLILEVPDFGKTVLRTSVISGCERKVNLLESLIHGRLAQINIELKNTGSTENMTSELRRIDKLNTDLSKLAKLMFLGEKIVVKQAEEKLVHKIISGETGDILFGCQAFGIQKGDEYKRLHQEFFDLGVAPLYFFLLKGKSLAETDWQLTDDIVNWLSQTGRAIKGHPLVWLHKHARRNWMVNMTFDELKKFLIEHVIAVVNRYKNKIKMWDIANEMPVADANGFDLTIDQLIEILKLTSDLVKKLQPGAERIINLSDIWGAGSFVQEKPSVPPIHFLKLCVERGVEFESIGLQFYMGMKKEFCCRDLLNISQSVDEFLTFGKSIHFSELGWPSTHDIDPDCFFSSDHPEAGGWWHQKWDEMLQAEFLGKIFTIFLSKPKVKSITWWDLTDNGLNSDIASRFLPFGGLTRRDFTPKPALSKLQKIKRRLGLSTKSKKSML